MPTTELVGVRIPCPLLEQIDAIATSEGRNRSQMIVRLLTQALETGADPSMGEVLQRLDAIEARLPDWRRLIA